MTPEEKERLLAKAASLPPIDMADGLLANKKKVDALIQTILSDVKAATDAARTKDAEAMAFLAWQEGTEGNTLNEALPGDATVDPDGLLEIWAAIDRCAAVAADALATEYERTTDFRPNRAGLHARFAEEIWLSVADAVAWARGDILDGLA